MEVLGRRIMKIAQERSPNKVKEERLREFVRNNEYAMEVLLPLFSSIDEGETREERDLRVDYEDKESDLWREKDVFIWKD